MVKKAIGFIRSRKYNHAFTPDYLLQKKQIEEYAKDNEYKITKIVWDSGNENKALYWSINQCRKRKLYFLYVNIGNWNSTTEFKRRLNLAHRAVQEGKEYWTPIAIPPDRRTLEAIERHARKENYFTNVGKFGQDKTESRRSNPLSEPETMIMDWKQLNRISTKRFNNFQHLYRGMEPIYTLFLEQSGQFSNREMANNLNYHFYLTVDGKRWNKDSVRKTRKLISDRYFQEFCELMKDMVGNW